MVPALQALQHDVIALPTVLLSNHPGHLHAAGTRIDVEVLARMKDALAANGWLGEVDTIVSGYLPSAAHVAFVADAVMDVRRLRPGARYVCDPVIGDDPKGLYVDADAAAAIRDRLLPLADAVLPNRFELAWLSGCTVDSAAAAVHAARSLAVPTVIATSIASASDRLETIEIDAGGAMAFEVVRRPYCPNGTGDLLAALFAAGWPLGRAVAAVDAVIAASAGADQLRIAQSFPSWQAALPLPAVAISAPR